MNGTAVNLLGSGGGVVTIAFGIFMSRHLDKIPGRQWAERLLILIMYAGGAAVTVTWLGQHIDSAARAGIGLLDSIQAGLPQTGLAIMLLFLLGTTILSLIYNPNPATAMLAAVLPLLLALTTGGILHDIYTVLNAPAIAAANHLNHWLAG